MIDSDTVKDLLNNARYSGTDQIIADCPICSKPKHFYINKNSFLWDCKKCGEEGNLYSLLKALDKLYLIRDSKTINKVGGLDKKIVLFEKPDFEYDINLLVDCKIPAGWKRIYENEYLEKTRKSRDNENFISFGERDFERYKVGKTELYRKFEDYVIFPVEYMGRGLAYISRNERDDERLRYVNSTSEFSNFLFGMDEITAKTETVIINEGFFDKRRWDIELNLFDSDVAKAVATFGHKISENQIKFLFQFHESKGGSLKTLIFCYDPDSIKQIKKYAQELIDLFEVFVCLPEAKDIDSCTPKQFENSFTNIKTFEDVFFKIVNTRKLK